MMQSPKIYQMPVVLFVVVLAAVLAVGGCGSGSGQGLDENGNPLGQSSGTPSGGGTGASGNPNATLAWLQQNVFGGVCSQCHIGNAVFNINWDTTTNTCLNVARASNEMNGNGTPPTPTLNEIERDDPDNSYVIWKVLGAGPNGEPLAPNTLRMPLGCSGASCLSPDTIQNMIDWIADGAIGC